MKPQTRELIVETSFRLVAESTQDGQRVQAEINTAKAIAEKIARATLELPIFENTTADANS